MGLLDFLGWLFSSGDDDSEDTGYKDTDGDGIPDKWDPNPYGYDEPQSLGPIDFGSFLDSNKDNNDTWGKTDT